MPIQYTAIGTHEFVNANNQHDIDFIDIDNFLKKSVCVNEIEHKSVIDVDKLIHANTVFSDWHRQVC